MFLTVSRHIPGPTVCFSHIPRFSVFSPYSRSYSVFFSVWKFFSVSHHIPGHTFFKSIFPRYSVFSPHSRSYSVCVSFSKFFSFLAIIQVLQCVFFIFSFYTIFYHIPGPTLVFLIFHDFTFSCLTPGPPVCISHLPGFSLFRATQQVKQCLYLIFHVFSVFSP